MDQFKVITYKSGEKPLEAKKGFVESSVIAKVYYNSESGEDFAGEIVEHIQFGNYKHISVYGREGKNSFSIGGVDKTVEEGVATIKFAYNEYLERLKQSTEEYNGFKFLVDEFHVSKEAYLDNGNIRTCVRNIGFYRVSIDAKQYRYDEMLKFINTRQFMELPQIPSEILSESLVEMRKEIEKIEELLNKEIEHLAGYNGQVQRKLDGVEK